MGKEYGVYEDVIFGGTVFKKGDICDPSATKAGEEEIKAMVQAKVLGPVDRRPTPETKMEGHSEVMKRGRGRPKK